VIGEFDKELLENIIEALPVEISLVDANDKVKCYNKDGKRIFMRTPQVIGLNVRKCHPEKSLDKVLTIINDFKAGKREFAEFWIDFRDKKVYIRYFPVKDKDGKYLGTLEVTQDITHIQGLEGEKRLLD